MGGYQDTLDDIKATMGIVPGFMQALPEDVLVHDWPLFKKYTFEQSAIPGKYRELAGLMVAANIKCPYCEAFHTATAKMRLRNGRRRALCTARGDQFAYYPQGGRV